MHKLGIVLVIILGVLGALWLSGAGMTLAPHASAGVGYTGFGMGPGMMSGIGTNIAPIYLALIIGAGLVCVLLVLARTPKHAMATTGRHAAATMDGSALEIAKARYAKGEITKEQFNGIKHDLRA